MFFLESIGCVHAMQLESTLRDMCGGRNKLYMECVVLCGVICDSMRRCNC